ncbi:hypothetical protein J437_LFUL011873 [Ladona fulva]|uniref:SRA1/Sec31 domain-containing protein n=1 Tax=Ladona fulva TaxID=123851 RepID=A0A8K0KC22_LADFU|nr:hypothetical protein J437_LFUL011873 [Ladona fulva]
MASGPSYYQQPTEPYYAQQQHPQSEGYSQPNPYMPSGTVEQPQPVQYQGSSQQPVSQMSNDPMSNLDASIRNFNTAMNSIALGTLKKDEIGQSLQLLHSSWREQKLSLEVQDITLKLSIALCNGDTAYAESLLSSLNTNHYQSCHEWISGPSTLLQVAISVKQSVF